jgi:regulator of sigma E protease
LAIVIFAAIFMFYGKHSTAARVDTVAAESPAAAAGFQPDDLIVSIDGRPIESFNDVQRIVRLRPGQPLEIVVERGGVRQTLRATPTATKDSWGNRIGQLGISRPVGPGDVKVQKVGPLDAVALGFGETWLVVEQTMTYLYEVVVGRQSADQLGGPIRIAQVAGQVATLGFIPILHLAAVLSVSIGLLNLFPIPLLDGGHLLFYAVEVVRGRPLSERAQEIGFRIGLAVVLMLMIFATYNDIRPWAGL